MRHIFVTGLILLWTICRSVQGADLETSSVPLDSALRQTKWNHGSADCRSNADPAIEVFRYDQSSYVLRQNKCLSFEAPFLYVLFGDEKLLLFDTGATESDLDFPLYETVQSLIKEQARQDGKTERELLVVHSHSHSDHYAGDSQFDGQPNVTLIKPGGETLIQFFDFRDWPEGIALIELGGRQLTVIPTPGHQEEAITVYDPQTKWLLTGDTVYPGYIYVKNWSAYTKSIARLVEFTHEYEVIAIVGAHVEMTKIPGEYYPIGTTYQPNEASLALHPDTLEALNVALGKSDAPGKIVFDEFIVVPMSTFQKIVSGVAKWIFQ